MDIWVVRFDPSSVKDATFDDLYARGLQLVDLESRTRIQRFYRREDAFRSLIGCLLPRVMLYERGIPNNEISFAKTQANKPYINISASVLSEPIGFNVTHDAGVVAMACIAGSDQAWNDPPAHRIGVDIMKLKIPDRFTFRSFVQTIGDALTTFEKSSLSPSPPVSESESLYHFYLIWTLKEAYTKALGLGLGFDFKRVEYDYAANRIRVDGAVIKGWEFYVFRLSDDLVAMDNYVGAAAKYVGGNEEAVVKKGAEVLTLVRTTSAEEFLIRTVRELGEL